MANLFGGVCYKKAFDYHCFVAPAFDAVRLVAVRWRLGRGSIEAVTGGQ